MVLGEWKPLNKTFIEKIKNKQPLRQSDCSAVKVDQAEWQSDANIECCMFTNSLYNRETLDQWKSYNFGKWMKTITRDAFTSKKFIAHMLWFYNVNGALKALLYVLSTILLYLFSKQYLILILSW